MATMVTTSCIRDCCHGYLPLQPLTLPAYSLRIDASSVNQTHTSSIVSIVVSGISSTSFEIPSFGATSFTHTISEGSPIGTLLIPSLYAVASGTITYSLGGGGCEAFSVDPITGRPVWGRGGGGGALLPWRLHC